jgi:hypothetical protein
LGFTCYNHAKKGVIITYTIIHLIHLYGAFIYGGFLFTDNLFLSKIGQSLGDEEAKKAREAFMQHVRKVVPPALIVTVLTGIYMFTQVFGEIGPDGMSRFQILLSIKAFLGLWLGIRGFNQVYLKINPWLFKSHRFPWILVIIIIALSQLMHL